MEILLTNFKLLRRSAGHSIVHITSVKAPTQIFTQRIVFLVEDQQHYKKNAKVHKTSEIESLANFNIHNANLF